MARRSKGFQQLFYPDNVQKRNPSVTPSQRQKELASFRRFKQEMENDPDNENTVFVDNPENLRKMSEVLLEYIQPFLENTETSKERSHLVDTAVMAWNLTLISEEKREELIMELFSGAKGTEQQKGFERLIQRLIKRKLKFFAEEKRFVTDFKLTEHAGGIHLSVASSFKM